MPNVVKFIIALILLVPGAVGLFFTTCGLIIVTDGGTSAGMGWLFSLGGLAAVLICGYWIFYGLWREKP